MQEKVKTHEIHKILITIGLLFSYVTVTLCAIMAMLPTFFISILLAIFILIVITILGIRLRKLLDLNSATKDSITSYWVLIITVIVMSLWMIYSILIFTENILSGLGGEQPSDPLIPWDVLWVGAILSVPLVVSSSLFAIYFIKRNEAKVIQGSSLTTAEKQNVKENIIQG